MHICHEEILAFLSFFGMAPVVGAWFRARAHRRKPCAHNDEAKK
jgi:hypothetical protein